jgi:cyclin-dependent kinase 12/13
MHAPENGTAQKTSAESKTTEGTSLGSAPWTVKPRLPSTSPALSSLGNAEQTFTAKPLNIQRRKEAPWKIRDDTVYEKLEQVGEGTYGEVYHARNRETGQEVALKRLRMANEREGFPLTACREIKVLRELRHENIVNLIEMVTSRGQGGTQTNRKGDIFMVFEYMDYDLTGLMDTPEIHFSEAQVKCYAQQLLRGLAYCHARGVMHRDIKGSNILISRDGKVKIADFGLARFLGETGRRYTNRVVTLWYRAPELLLGENCYGFAVDIWSAGCLILEMLTGRPVFPGKDEVSQANLIFSLLGTPTEDQWPGYRSLPYASTIFNAVPEAKHYPNVFRTVFGSKGLSSIALDFAEKLLTICPERRPTAAEALQHRWFTTEPLPCRPEELPRYDSVHEYQARKRRQLERHAQGVGGIAPNAGAALAMQARQGPVPSHGPLQMAQGGVPAAPVANIAYGVRGSAPAATTAAAMRSAVTYTNLRRPDSAARTPASAPLRASELSPGGYNSLARPGAKRNPPENRPEPLSRESKRERSQ